MQGDLPSKFALNRWSLGYDDPALEAEYQIYQPAMLIRSLRPLFWVLLPVSILVGLVDFAGLLRQSPVPWQACAVLVFALSALLVLGSIHRGSRFIQPALLATFVLFGLTLLLRISNVEELRRFFPGYFIVILMSHFVGLRFTGGLTAALLLVGGLVAAIVGNHIGFASILDLLVFLVPGYAIAATAGYTMERQRRRLFAQLKLLEQERRIHEQMALHDPLTNLPNRTLLHERMEQSLARSKRQHGQFAVLFVDLDDFKAVNDSHGHSIGDLVLREIADNLQDQVRGEDTVARLGGDEFVVLSEHIEDERGATTAAERIQAAVSIPIVINVDSPVERIEVHVTCSIGISLCPRDGDTLDELISRADDAMYKAKRHGKGGSRFYRDDVDESDVQEPSAG